MLERKSTLAAKIEATPGTAEALSAADVPACDIFEASEQAEIENEPREAIGGGGSSASAPGARGATCTFKCEMAGSGSGGSPVPDWAEIFLPACAFVNSTGDVYSPELRAPDDAAGSTKTLTIGFYQDGVYKQMHGAMGTFIITGESGKRVMVEFTFTGLWDEPTDVAQLTPGVQAARAVRLASATMTIASWTPRVANLSIDAGNEVVLRESQATDEGYYLATVADRAIAGSMDPESVLVATNDSWQQWLNQTEQAFSLALGADAGNTITIAAPKLQFRNLQHGARNKIATTDTEFQCNKDSAGGDDDLTIEFS